MKFKVYSVRRGNNLIWDISLELDADLTFWHNQGIEEILVLEKDFSIGHAKELVNYLQHQDDLAVHFFNKKNYTLKRINTIEGSDLLLSTYKEWKNSIYPFLEGRLLLMEEFTKLNILASPLNNSINLNRLIQTGYLLKDIDVRPSVSYPYKVDIKYKKKDFNSCNYCGSTKDIIEMSCVSCEDYCAVCEACISIGRSRTCSPLLYFKNENSIKEKNFDDINITMETLQFTDFQREVADYAVDFTNSETKQLLIWAVTGAGKTEMIYPAIKAALAKGNKVLFTAPRKDVIKELTVRFRNTFKGVSIVSLYGGSNERWEKGNLYLMTTHQTIRFYKFFDFVVIDELDAFPYQNNHRLHYLVNRSLKESAKVIFMTATPSEEWQINIKQGRIDYKILPARYHMHPLPVPIIKVIPKKSDILSLKRSPKIIHQFLCEVSQTGGSALIFVAKVADVELWVNKLRSWFPDEKIDGIHATDFERENKIKLFRVKKIDLLVTTTILERGVTFPNLHVMVMNAEAKLFDSATLIQIAGRVGRTAEFPDGLIWFLAEYMTNDIIKAKKEIKKMNKLAKKISEHNVNIRVFW